MKFAKIIVMAFAVVLISLIAIGTQAAGNKTLEGRHCIGLSAGMWNQVTGTRTEIGIGGVSTEVGSGGAMGGVIYSHWLKEQLALHIGVRGLATDVGAAVGIGNVTSVTSNLGSILFGMKYYFPASTLGSSVRPYADGAIGTFIGDQSETSVGLTVTTESRTEVAPGGRLAAGMDWIISRSFMGGVSVGYNLMSDFRSAVGGSKNYSGPEFSFSFGYLFGSGR